MFFEKIKQNVKLAPYTTFKIGGPAKYFIEADSEKELQDAVKEAKNMHLPFFILGKGSNIIISDLGFAGLVIRLNFHQITHENNVITASADISLGELLNYAKEKELSGLEFLAGIPATVGGALWANAGSIESSIGSYIDAVKIADENGSIKKISKKECDFKYRDSFFKHNKKAIILSAAFVLKMASCQEIEFKMKKSIEKKIKTQDLKYPSAGSIFKNPLGNKKAWELIRELNLPGFQIGGAKISEKHANFIINTGQATASDVIMLISLIKQKVRDQLGVQLMEEIEYIGF